jgi:hypothetical protein
MDFESHWFDTSQFMNHKTKYMRHNAFCYYSVKHKGNSTAQPSTFRDDTVTLKHYGFL